MPHDLRPRPPRTASPARPAPICCSTRTTPCTGGRGAPEALAEAKRTNRPILLSVGYAACHWCHVMAHESFEDAGHRRGDERAVRQHQGRPRGAPRRRRHLHARAAHPRRAGRLAAHHVPRREARPFWGGTYFPPTPRYGRPGFTDVLREVARIYREEPRQGRATTPACWSTRSNAAARQRRGHRRRSPTLLLADLTGRMVSAVDPRARRAVGRAEVSAVELLLAAVARRHSLRPRRPPGMPSTPRSTTSARAASTITSAAASRATRSTSDWLVPHFEKMLYDNALLIDLLCEAWRETGKRRSTPRASTRPCDWLLREMVAEGGGFAASLDADSEGEEGKFYVWTQAEIDRGAGRGRRASVRRGLRRHAEAGNWEGHTILNRLRNPLLGSPTEEQGAGRACAPSCWRARAKRVRPGWDDKVLADWNGLMIAALAHAARVFDRAEWLAPPPRAFALRRAAHGDRTAGSSIPIAPARPRRRAPPATTPT